MGGARRCWRVPSCGFDFFGCCFCRSRERGFNGILRAIGGNKSIAMLHLTGNMTVFSRMSLRACRILMDAVARNTFLVHLNIAGKSIGNEAAPLVSNMLTTNNTLISLDLSGNMLMTAVRGGRRDCGADEEGGG